MSASLLPIFVKLEGRPCLVVGAGVVALQKITSLLESGANVTVIAPEAREEVRDLAARQKIHWLQRPYIPEDIAGHHLVIAASSDVDVNHAVYGDAVRAGVLANAVDDPPFCDFYFGSVVRRGPLQIGISTAGESPALAQRLRQQLEAMLDDAVGPWLERLGGLRRQVLAAKPAGEARNRLLRTLASRDVCDAEACPSRQLALGAIPKEHTSQEIGSWWLT
ncbi:MAG: siroheme synthase, N-terminal domain protein [Acidobacteria bacterium]|jgi:precorrin-2 dehydrogenase/sirohydrochlorin ferrochelatase|nr:siroheme synthase, N-terminal domain protein [Acidobacteriota bacterium]